MTHHYATVGMVANFGPITTADLAAITGWTAEEASRRGCHAVKNGHLRRQNVDGKQCLVLARPVCLHGATA